MLIPPHFESSHLPFVTSQMGVVSTQTPAHGWILKGPVIDLVSEVTMALISAGVSQSTSKQPLYVN
jgi:hypothetical protein